MLRFFLIIILAIVATYASLEWTSGLIEPIYKSILSAFFVIATLFSALSFALFSYVEGISKDLPSRSGLDDSEKLDRAIMSLQKLRKEVIINACVVIGMLIVERAVFGMEEMIREQGFGSQPQLFWLLLSIRSSCLIITLIAAWSQLHGFITAAEFRSIISRHKP